ncbi:MAG: hypothetical protein VB115_14430 [Christensenellaceae bacterium]|nr:hypothetical protein [Christensenellaceae bacterium]
MDTKLKMSVINYPDIITLDREVKHLKCALLYGDDVRLISLSAGIFSSMTDVRFDDELAMLKSIKNASELVKTSHYQLYVRSLEEFGKLEQIIRSTRYKNAPFYMKAELRLGLKRQLELMSEKVREIVGTSNAEDIEKMMSNGMLRIDQFDSRFNAGDDFAFEFCNKLFHAIETTFPIFDAQTNEFIRELLKDGVFCITSRQAKKASHAGIADNLLAKLPTLDFAPIDEIMDIRNELREPLVRFRKELSLYADTITSVPWDQDFSYECDSLYHQKVAPTVLDINESIRENSFVRNLIGNLSTNKVFLSSLGTLAFTITVSGFLKTLSEIASNGALVAGTTLLVREMAIAYKEYRKKHNEVKKNGLYFYHQAGQLLGI